MHLSDFVLYYYGYKLLLHIEQYDLIQIAKKENKLKNICFQVVGYNKTIYKGLKSYVDNTKLLINLYERKYQSNIINISQPQTIKVKYLDELYLEYENVGLKNISKCGFVLVAGGIGERLNNNRIKISLPIDQISKYSYLKLYLRYILSYQSISDDMNYICIMTSESTDKMTRHYLEENNYFGLLKTQFSFIKQNNVPSFNSYKCDFFYENGKIIDKPHGHGDIHHLLYENNILNKWKKKGIEHFVIFQDTNSLSFEAIPVLFGSTIKNNSDVNYLIVKRYEGEKASILCCCEENGRRYNVRAIDYSCLTGILGENINNNNIKQSYYPAVTNVICFNLDSYYNTLIRTKGILQEYILSSNKNKSFRLESVLQDYIVLTDIKSKINSLLMSRWLCFNPVKEMANVNDFYTPDDGENKLYYRNKKKLSKIGWNIGENTFIHIDPLISSSTDCIKNHFQGVIEVINNSKLVIEGNVYINKLYLNGSLIVKVKRGGILKLTNININNKGIEYSKNNEEYFKKKVISKREVILEYGNGLYELTGNILYT